MRRLIRICAVGLGAALLLSAGRAGALQRLAPGEVPPPVSLPDLAGRTVAMREQIAGSPAVVLFWSTWSPRSEEMLDDFKRHFQTYGSRGLKIVAVNIEGENLSPEKKAAVRKFAAARELPFPVLLDERLEAFAVWGIMAHPTEVVLNAEGRIAYILPGYPLSMREELKDAIEKVLGIEAPPPRPELPSVGYVPKGGALMHYNLGRRMLAKGDTDRALEGFRKASAADPDFIEPAILRARIALALGNLDEAERFVRGANPEVIGRGDLRYLLGNLMLLKGEVEAAERAFRGLEEKLPQEGWGGWGLGLAALAREDPAGALEHLERAKALQPENLEAEAYLERYLRERWLRRESVPEEDRFVKIFPALEALRDRYRRLYVPDG